MKHSTYSEFNKSIQNHIEKKKDLTLPLELLLYTLSTNRGEVVICVNEDEFSNLFHNYSSVYRDVDFLPPLSFFDKKAPIGFKSTANEYREKALSQLAINEIPELLISTKKAISESSLEINQVNCFNISLDLDYDLLVEWLTSSSYTFEEVVSKQGDCVLKGGLIDIYPYNKTYPVRISFLSEEVEVFRFNIESQITLDSIKLTKLSDKHILGSSSVYSIIENKAKVVNYSQECLKKADNSFTPISFREFSKDSTLQNLSIETSSLLINSGYIFSDIIVIPEWFLNRSPGKQKETTQEAIDFNTLSVGDRLVHKYHGVSEYRGIYDFGCDSFSDERLLLEFSDGGKIYVSTQNLGLIEYHSSSDISSFDLDSLSKKGIWQKKKKQAKKQVEEIIDDLLKGYASRSISNKSPVMPDPEIELQFLQAFPFEETADQKRTWNEVSKDLSSEKPMDRLLCGDVGFGKTEIALRAAFRTVFAGKQVAVLAPTTILANQHFHTFCARLGPFSVNIGIVSTFKSKSENTKTIIKLKNNEIDIVIGTHSLLSPNIQFSKLGLLIVDEEHRFGVKQKDKILDVKNNIDVLSMSATPIPRTLHMSLSGIKSISTINTPPRARFPINTQVQYYDVEHIKSLILFEINRGGQVFFVHNSIKSLDEMVQTLRLKLPNLKIEPAHGQEPKRQLEKTMAQFIDGDIDVLVCTSIIETGIDIPNVNTVIINRSHRFGLSQLYQIRGRVGRSDKQAFAYLLIPKGYQLSKNAYKRLKSIEKNTSLGSGYNISKSDMEIRGVGTIFGYKQSGGLSQVGYGLYSKLIKESLEERKIIEKSFILDPEDASVKLYIDMAIPNEYIASESIRLEFYRKLSKSDALDGFSKIEYELENRFGPRPGSVINLINNYKARIYCAKLGVKKCVYSENILQLEFLANGVASSTDLFIPNMVSFCSEQNTEPRFLPGEDKALVVNIKLNKNVDIYTFVESILDKLTALILA